MSSSTFEQLVFWCIGYGGWMGVGILPVILVATDSNKMRAVLFFLAPPTCALLMTTAFSTLYGISKFFHFMSSIMISPFFLNSATGSAALSIILFSCVFYGMDAFAPHRVQKMVEAEKAREGESEEESEEDVGSSESDGSEEASEGSEGSEEEPEEDVGSSEESEEASDEDVRDAAIALINLDPLRNAPPLPESDSE
jgi:hypothetical protein